MDNINIYYFIEPPIRPINDVYDILGGIKIVANDVIVTKMVDNESDNGYCGNFLFIDSKCLLHQIPALIAGKRIKCEVDEQFYEFVLESKVDFIYFSIKHDPRYRESAEFDKRYPGEGKGYPLPTKPFLKELVAMGRQFLGDVLKINGKLAETKEVISYKKDLEVAEALVRG